MCPLTYAGLKVSVQTKAKFSAVAGVRTISVSAQCSASYQTSTVAVVTSIAAFINICRQQRDLVLKTRRNFQQSDVDHANNKYSQKNLDLYYAFNLD